MAHTVCPCTYPTCGCAWQEAECPQYRIRNATLEEAAQLCDSIKTSAGAGVVLIRIAAELRALKR